MKQEQFELRYQDFWSHFELLISGLDSKNGIDEDRQAVSDLGQFSSAYRRVCNHLAIAKKRRYSARIINRLNYMVMKGHQHLYQRKTAFLFQAIQFVLAEFPCCLRRNAFVFWVATAIFYLPAILMFALVLLNPELIYSVLSSMQLTEYEAMYDPVLDKIGRERQSDTDLAMFGYYIYNNIGIAFQTFASGLLLAVGAIFYLVFNGVLIGSLAAHIVSINYEVTFFPFIVGHASFELTAITIAGAAGIKLGLSVLSPKNLSRLASLRQASEESIKLIIGAAIMLLFAAFIEAYWSSINSLAPMIKYSVGAVLWALVCFYLAFAGKGSRFES
tara:strand:+ start:13147 stop:14139 length:993 start_codon:yes stop_codon:yes gene_type:complete